MDDFVPVDLQRDVIQLQTGRVTALLDALEAEDEECDENDPECEPATPTPSAEDEADAEIESGTDDG